MGEETQTKLSRQEILKRAGVAAGAAVVVAPFGRVSVAWGRSAAPRPIRIGQLLTLSGPLASVGLELQKGFQAYVNQAQHRLGGRRIQFFVEDDGGDPATAIQKVQKLVREDHVDVIHGVVASNVADAIRDTIVSLKIPTIISNAAANDLTRDKGSPYIFRSCYTNSQIGISMAAYLFNRVSKSVYTAGANYTAGTEVIGGFVAGYRKLGGKLDGQVFPPFGTTNDYSPYLSQIADAKPAAVFAFFPGADAIKFVRQYDQYGLKRSIPLYGAFITDPDSVLNVEGKAALDVQTSAVWAETLKNKENVRFVAAYSKAFGSLALPSTFAVTAHDAAQILDVALHTIHGKIENKSAFLRAVKNVGTLKTPSGTIKMDPKTQNPIRPFYRRRVVRRPDGSSHNQLVGNLGVFGDPR